jgi:site-specific recombinase XerD
MEQKSPRTIAGARLAELLRATREAFLCAPEMQEHCAHYLRWSRIIIEAYARSCELDGDGHPWRLRRSYLARRDQRRSKQSFSASYLTNHGRELRRFLRWYYEHLAARELTMGELSPAQLHSYWATQPRALPYRQRILRIHLSGLLELLRHKPKVKPGGDLRPLLDHYFEQRRLAMRKKGYVAEVTRNAQIVTHRLLLWLEQQGHLPADTAADAGVTIPERDEGGREGLLRRYALKLSPELPKGLRQPLLDYLEQLVYEQELTRASIHGIWRPNLALCHRLAAAGHDSFAQLRTKLLDEVVLALLSAPCSDLLGRRRQVQKLHSQFRGFLRFLHRRGLIARDLASTLISPPCYRASKPPNVLSEQQVRSLLESVDRRDADGRRCYAILLLITTYGLRPTDVSWLRLEDLHWRQQPRIALVQNKTGRALTLPLMPIVATALYDYLRHDRVSGSPHRQIFVSLDWPHRPVTSYTVSTVVTRALRRAGLSRGGARTLRASVATHLLRQGEALSAIQEVLGHRTVETTQRYAVMDVEILRQVLEEAER